MNTSPTDVSASPSSGPATTAAAPAGAVAAPARASSAFTVIALLLAALSLVLVGLLWQRLSFTQEELARRARDSEVQVLEARTLAAQAESLTQEMQARLAVAEIRLSEVSLQRSQLEELMLSLSRSRDDNLVQDLEATVRLALQQAQLTGSAQPLVSALQAADQRIARAAQPRLNPVQRAIARDIERIRGSALADIPALALQIDELVRQVDSWPVANAVGVALPPTAPPPADSASAPSDPTPAGSSQAGVSEPPSSDNQAGAASVGNAADHASDDTEAQAGGVAQGWQRVSAWWRGWTGALLADAVRGARDIVRVSRIDQPDAALLAPEQAFFLRENIKLKLLNARLALLARQMPASRADVVAVEAQLQRYFDLRSPAVVAALNSLSRLRRDLVTSELPRPDETTAALAAAAGGR